MHIEDGEDRHDASLVAVELDDHFHDGPAVGRREQILSIVHLSAWVRPVIVDLLRIAQGTLDRIEGVGEVRTLHKYLPVPDIVRQDDLAPPWVLPAQTFQRI